MRLSIAMILAGSMVLPAVADECRMDKARYSQPDTSWTLTLFKPAKPEAPNHVSSFTIALGKGNPKLTGAIFMPNGFSQPYGILNPKCLDGDQADDCKLWEGVLYATGPQGIGTLPEQVEAPAPQQILLPGFAAAMWYSQYAGVGYDSEPSDVFTLTSCDP